MPIEQEVRVYARADGSEPFTQWLRGLRDGATRNRIRQRIARIRLGNFGDARRSGTVCMSFVSTLDLATGCTSVATVMRL